MKFLQTALILSAMVLSTSALAVTPNLNAAGNDFKIEGATGDLGSGCGFTGTSDGAMAWNELEHKWTTTNPATVSATVRDIASIDITTDKKLRDTIGITDEVLTVQYDESSFVDTNPRYTPLAVNAENSFKLTNTGGGNKVILSIDHSVVPSDDFVAESNEAYHMQNTVTCTI